MGGEEVRKNQCRDRFKTSKCEKIKERRKCGNKLAKIWCKGTCGKCKESEPAPAAPEEDQSAKCFDMRPESVCNHTKQLGGCKRRHNVLRFQCRKTCEMC